VSAGGWVRRWALWTTTCPISGNSSSPAYCQPVCPLWCMSFLVPCLLFSFFVCFFMVGVVLSRDYADLSQGWLWEYRVSLICSPVGLHLPSRFGGLELASGGTGALLVSSCNVVWRSFVQAGDSGCRFCFCVFFSVLCGSSVSARFLIYGSHAVCFLPLVTILDPPLFAFLYELKN
jgi:hypothetical protein